MPTLRVGCRNCRCVQRTHNTFWRFDAHMQRSSANSPECAQISTVTVTRYAPSRCLKEAKCIHNCADWAIHCVPTFVHNSRYTHKSGILKSRSVMRRRILSSTVLLTLALSAPSRSSAQLVSTTPACTASGALATFGAQACSGAFVGNNKNQQADVLAQLAAFGGTWSLLGSSDDANFGPFTSNPGGTTGTLTFDNVITGPFALAIKAGNAFSLYYFLNGGAGVSSVNFTTAGVAVNAIDNPNGLSHATIYRGALNVVPEPSTYALLATGLFALGITARRRRA